MTLAAFERRWAGQIGAALIPPDALGGVRRDLDLGAALDGELRASTQATGAVLRLALWLVWLAPLGRGRFLTFGALDGAEREQLLEELLESGSYAVRELLNLLKLFVCMCFLGDRRVLAQLGAYDLGPGPVRIAPGPPRRPEGAP